MSAAGGMSFAQEKRRSLGLMALLAPLPLPFNQALEWPVLAVYALLVIYFLRRVERGAGSWLPNWALNVLALVYMPILVVDFGRGIARSSFLEPLLHLLLFLVLVKLFSLRRDRDKWQVMIAVFFTFVGSMATSSHLTVLLYMLVFLVLGMMVLGRFATYYVLAGVGQTVGPGAPRVRMRGPLTVGTLVILAIAVPLFASMPRFRDPFVFGPGSGDTLRSTGFSDSVDLNLTSSIRGNRDVVMRLTFDGSPPGELRFKAATYDRYRDRRWSRTSQLGIGVPVAMDERFRLIRPLGEPVSRAEIYLEPIQSRSLVLPIQTQAVGEIPVPAIFRDSGGAYSLPTPPRNPITYSVELTRQPVIVAGLRPRTGPGSPLDTEGLTPRMADLAREVMGAGSDDARVDRLLRHLLEGYGYTLDFVGRSGDSPLDEFLFEHKSGHCELFASAMVLMLRSEGIPARLAAGYLDAERNPLQGYYVVRQDNAHTWVEAWTEARGWRVYDPTPPEGRPSAREWSLRLAMTQLWDVLVFRWDRYVLSFGSEDQAGLFERVRDKVSAWWRSLMATLGGDAEEEAASTTGDASAASQGSAPPASRGSPWPLRLAWLLVAVTAVAVSWYLTRVRRPRDARAAYRRLRALLETVGCELTDASPPLAVQRLAVETLPAAAADSRLLIGLYLEQSFGGRALTRGDQGRLQSALGALSRAASDLRRGRR